MRSARRVLATLPTVVLTAVLWAAATPAGPADAAAAPTTLRTDGIGPLTLGMSRTAAVRTGWLSGRGTGCPLGGRPYPITYALRGSKAPKALRGTVEFVGGKLSDATFTRGVRTTTGVTVGSTTTSMVTKFRAGGFQASREPSKTFGGTFIHVTKGGDDVLAGFAEGSGKRVGQLGIPSIPVCE